MKPLSVVPDRRMPAHYDSPPARRGGILSADEVVQVQLFREAGVSGAGP